MSYSLEFNNQALKEWEKLGSTIKEQFKKSSENACKTHGLLQPNFPGQQTYIKLNCAPQATGWYTRLWV